MPLSVCSAMWQCAIHSPGLVTSSRMSTVSPGPDQHRVLPHQVRLRRRRRGQDQERPAPCTWNGWCIGWSESISLTSRIFTRSPTRNRQSIACVRSPGVPVDQDPPHVRWGGHAGSPRPCRPPTRCRLRHAACVARAVMGARRRRRASWARAWCSRVLERRPGPGAIGSSFIPQSGHRAGSSLTTSGSIGQAYRGRLGRLRPRDQLHPALRAAAGLRRWSPPGASGRRRRRGAVRVGGVHVHLGDERRASCPARARASA